MKVIAVSNSGRKVNVSPDRGVNFVTCKEMKYFIWQFANKILMYLQLGDAL